MSLIKIITSGLVALILWFTMAAAKVTRMPHTQKVSKWTNIMPSLARVVREASMGKCHRAQAMCSAPDKANQDWTYAEWAIDSGCTKRFVHPDLEKYMMNSAASHTSIQGFEGGKTTHARMKGNLHMHFFTENEHKGNSSCRSMAHTTTVESVPDLNHNLFGFSDMIQGGYSASMDKDGCRFKITNPKTGHSEFLPFDYDHSSRSFIARVIISHDPQISARVVDTILTKIDNNQDWKWFAGKYLLSAPTGAEAWRTYGTDNRECKGRHHAANSTTTQTTN